MQYRKGSRAAQRGRAGGIWLLALALLCACGGAIAQAPGATSPSDLHVAITAPQAKIARDDEVVVEVTVSNPGDAPQRVLAWWLPHGEPGDSLFDITRDGVPVAYEGKLIKRAAPGAGDYVVFAPGEQRRFALDLAPHYDFSDGGRYAIAYDTALLAGDLSHDAGRVKIARVTTSETLVLEIESRPLPRRPGFRAKAVVGSNSFAGCSVARQNDLIAARIAADDYAALAVDYLGANRTGLRYTSWFGAYTAGRYGIVDGNFAAISDALQNANPIAFDCTCTEGYYAYVYANQPYVIYLCNAFWDAPMTGTDSKSGTVIHELSHFTVVAGTDDHAYGQTNARSLAISDPARAVDNADSHEYFSENTPAQEVGVPDAPTALQAQAGNASASISFTPGYHGGAALTNYQYSTDGGGQWTALAPADTSAPVAVGGLANGVPVSFRLRAVNAVGPGAPSAASNSVTPSVPVAPADLGLTITRTVPATAQLFDGLSGPDPVASYRIVVTNQRATRVDALGASVVAGGALRTPAWTCTVSGASCSPASGGGNLSVTLSLDAGQSATLELDAAVAADDDFAELYARAALPPGLVPLQAAEVRTSLIEAATTAGVHRSGFE